MGLAKEVGAIRSGLRADLIAVRKNPLLDPKAFRDVVAVIKGGELLKAP
jgi:imidazolonepropionase-like amidohydrolase